MTLIRYLTDLTLAVAAGMVIVACMRDAENETKLPLFTRRAIVHDYIFDNATKACVRHDGLHYVVTDTQIFESGPSGEYPCEQTMKFRCQDGKLITFNNGVKACFISESQIRESF